MEPLSGNINKKFFKSAKVQSWLVPNLWELQIALSDIALSDIALSDMKRIGWTIAEIAIKIYILASTNIYY